MCRPIVAIERRHQRQRRREQFGVRFALRKADIQYGACRIQRRQTIGAVEQPRRMAFLKLNGEISEMLLKPGAPGGGQQVSLFQNATIAARLPAAHHAGKPAMFLRQQLQNHRRFAVPSRRKNDTAIHPFHSASYPSRRARRTA